MKSLLRWCFIGPWLLFTVSGLLVSDGPCSSYNFSNVRNFNKSQFMGEWFMYTGYDHSEVLGIDCISFNIQLTKNGSAEGFSKYKELTSQVSGTAKTFLKFDRPGLAQYKYVIVTTSSCSAIDGVEEKIHIIDVDYNAYAIEYLCKNVGTEAYSYIGVYTRLPKPTAKTIEKINKFLENFDNFDRTKLRYINQDRSVCTF